MRFVRTFLILAPLTLAAGCADPTAKENATSEQWMHKPNIRLACTYSHSVNGRGEQSRTTQEVSFTIKHLNGGVRVDQEGGNLTFIGEMTDEAINAEDIGKSLFINRFTGAFQISSRTGHNSLDTQPPLIFGAGANPSLTHFGECRPVTDPLF